MEKIVQQFPPYRKEDAHHAHDEHGHVHHDPGFMRQYVFSTDHKIIGIQYGFTALCFLLFGFFLMLMMRWQIAHPGAALPIVGTLIHAVSGDVMSPAVKDAAGNVIGYAISSELYNAFGAMHGTIMVFLGIVPLAFAAFSLAGW
jgi:cytochrome c oxidase subunit 1